LDFNQIVISNNCKYFKCLNNGTIAVGENLDYCNKMCFYYQWSSWSSCPVCSLDKVYKNRTRQRSSGFNLNNNCTETLESQECNIPLCSCIDGYNCPCILSEWSYWSSCSKSCGLGSKSRERKFISTGLNCSYENLVERNDCNTQCCPGYFYF